jgi:hypothetical protein
MLIPLILVDYDTVMKGTKGTTNLVFDEELSVPPDQVFDIQDKIGEGYTYIQV